MKSVAILSCMLCFSIFALNEAIPGIIPHKQCKALPYCQDGVCQPRCGRFCFPPCRANPLPVNCMAKPYCEAGVCKPMCGRRFCFPPCSVKPGPGGPVHCMAMPYCEAGVCKPMCGNSNCNPPCTVY